MSFQSETILKFANVPASFAVGTLLSYSMQNEKMGAFNYRRKEVISLEGLFSQKGVSRPVCEHFNDVKDLLTNSVDFVDLKLNDVPYGKARFISFNFPISVSFDENAINLSKFTIQLEIIKEDDDSTFANANLPSDVQTLNTSNDLWKWYKLKDFSEDFSFKLGEDGNFEASHSISFQYDPGEAISDASLSVAATDIANGFFKQALKDVSLIDSLYSSADFQSSVSDYGSSLTEQSVDLINYKFAYSKNYTVFSQNGTNTSETITTEVSYKDDGSIEVSEKGRIKGKGTSYAGARTSAISKLNTNLSDAYTRCNASFSRIQDLIPKYSGSNTLQTNPISITKDLTDVTPEVGYEIKFTTNPIFVDSTLIHSYSVNVKKNSQGICEASINGSFKSLSNKKTSYRFSAIRTALIDFNDINAINPYYKIIFKATADFAGIKTESSIQSSTFGVETSYTKSYSNSPTLKSGTGLVRQLTSSESLVIPVNKYSTTMPISSKGSLNSRRYNKEIIYQTRQLSEGSKSIDLEMKINREYLYSDKANGSNLNALVIFTKIKDLFTFEMLDRQSGYLFTGSDQPGIKVFSKIYKELNCKPGDLTFFLDSLKLSIDDNYSLKVVLVYKFLITQEQT